MMKIPSSYNQIKTASDELGFDMPSDIYTGILLRNIAARKRNARFLELGTGTGLATSFILDGMDTVSSLISIEKEHSCISIAQKYLSADTRLHLVHADGEAWIPQHKAERFDFIFADTWPGKYLLLEEALEMLNPGGIYVIDDMLPQSNWPEGHDKKVALLKTQLGDRADLDIQSMEWGSGFIVATKR